MDIKDTYIQVRVSTKFKEKLQDYCNKKNINMSNFITYTLTKEIRKK